MAINIIHCTGCFIIFTFCVGHGDGRWKERDKEKLYHDIDVFKKMAEKIEYEIEAFYEDYPDEQIKGDDIENVHQVSVKNIRVHKKGTKHSLDKTDTAQKFSFNATESKITALKPGNVTQSQHSPVTFHNNEPSKVATSNWPKFEDILLEMGKRYDWKNDRWIKVKRKLGKPPKVNNQVDNSIIFHEKHKFSYRTVKLNRKSRRNVVIAVTAVR